jgi:hypothetical protein
VCLSCSRELGFAPEASALLAFEAAATTVELEGVSYRKCANYVDNGVCNWLVEVESPSELCQACALNRVIPDLSQPDNHALWLEVEKAKRRLVYSLNQLGLPLSSKRDDPERGLFFDIKADVGGEHVLTGHDDGLITLNLSEADAAEREKMRLAMKERYRTLLGHFRHEIGHYYWDRLVRDAGGNEPFREVFGDERADYAEALTRHYANAPDPNFAEHFISHYAASHPWEDFAETFAHYLHVVDTLETAQQFGFASAAAVPQNFEQLMTEWFQLSVALNSLNRSMGLPDAYPFAITTPVKEKLRYIDELIQAARRASSSATFSSSPRAGPGMIDLSASTAV